MFATETASEIEALNALVESIEDAQMAVRLIRESEQLIAEKARKIAWLREQEARGGVLATHYDVAYACQRLGAQIAFERAHLGRLQSRHYRLTGESIQTRDAGRDTSDYDALQRRIDDQEAA